MSHLLRWRGLRLVTGPLLALAVTGCHTTIEREDLALEPPALRGVRPGDALDEDMTAFATRAPSLTSYLVPILLPYALVEHPPEPVGAPAIFEGVDLSDAPLRSVGVHDFGRVLVYGPRADDGRRLEIVWIEGFEDPESGEVELATVPVDALGLGPLELGGATPTSVVWRTTRPGVFVCDHSYGSALLLGPADLLERGTFPSLLAPDAPQLLVLRGWPEAIAAAGREGWPFARVRPVLEGVLALGESTESGKFARPAAWELLRVAVPELVAARHAAWAQELAAIPAHELAALVPLLRGLDPGNQRGLVDAAVTSHLERRVRAGQHFAAAGSAEALGRFFAWGHEPPDAGELLVGAALLPPLEVTGPGAEVLARTLAARLPDLQVRPLATDEAGVRIVIEEEETVTVDDRPDGEERRTKRNPAHDEWEVRGQQLERDAVTQEEVADANRYYEITEWQHRNLRQTTIYQGADGGELGRSTELVGREEFLVVVGVDHDMKQRHEQALAALERTRRAREEHARSEPPREVTYTVPMTVQTFGGEVRWRVTVTGTLEDRLEGQRTATAALGHGHRVESPLARNHVLDRVRQAVTDELAARLTPALARTGEGARGRYLAAFTDPAAREEEAAWVRRRRGEPSAPGDERFTGSR